MSRPGSGYELPGERVLQTVAHVARDPHPAPSYARRGATPGPGCRGTLRGPRLRIHMHPRPLQLQGRPWPGLGRVLLLQPLGGQEGSECCGGWTRRGPREEPRPHESPTPGPARQPPRAAALGGPQPEWDPQPSSLADLTHASHQPSPGWAGPQGEGRPADLQPGSGQQLPQGLLRLPDLHLRLPPKEGQRLSLFPPVQLQGGEEQPQDSPGPPPAAPTPPPAPWQGPCLRGQAVSPPRTGPLQSVPTGGLLSSPQPPCLGPAGSLGFLPAPGSPPPSQLWGPCHSASGVKAAPGGPPNRSGLKATHLQGLQETQRLLPDVGQRPCRNHRKGWLGSLTSLASLLGLQDTRWGRARSLPIGVAGRAPSLRARRQIAALPYPAPPRGWGALPP